MAKEEKGFFDSLVEDLAINIEIKSAIEASRDEKGKIDVYKATGIAMGHGHTSADDIAMIGAILGSEGAFEDNENSDSDCIEDIPIPITSIDEEWIDFQPTKKSSKDFDSSYDDYTSQKKQKNQLQQIKNIPQNINEHSYKAYRFEMQTEIISAIITFIICSAPIFIIMGASISAANEPHNDAGGFLAFVICSLGIFAISIFVYTVFHHINVAKRNIKLAKQKLVEMNRHNNEEK